MVRFMKINPKFRGGMIKTMSGLKPLLRNIRGAGSGVRPPIGQFKRITLNTPVRVAESVAEIEGSGAKSKKQTYRKLKFSI